jgi:RNA polymerase sigma-70 factor (ECF subfamily)
MGQPLRKREPRPARVDSAPRGPDDAELVRRARDGDRWAFEAIFRRHVDGVLGLATRMLGRTGEADDVAQDTFAAAFTRLERLDEPERLRSWLFGIAVHRIQRRLRHRRWLAFFGADVDGGLYELAAATASPEVRGELVLVDGILAQLPVAERIAWALRHVEGESLGDIAAITGASLATVKRRIAAVEVRMAAVIARGDRS